MGNVFHKSGGGSPVAPITGPVPTATATAIVAPFSISNRETHEANVEFTRDLVVQLVENLPVKSVKVEPPVVHIIREPPNKDSSSCKSLAVSENSFTSASNGDASESRHLQSGDTDKKQVETDTDTTEYESAGDSTVPPSPLGSLTGDYYPQEKNDQCAEVSPLEVKSSSCAKTEERAHNADDTPDAIVVLPQVKNDLNITDLCSAFDGVNLNSTQGSVPSSPVVSSIQKSSNISELCLALNGVHLQSPIIVSSNGALDNYCDSSVSFECQSTPVSNDKLPVSLKTPNFTQYFTAVEDRNEQHVSSLPIFDNPPEFSCSEKLVVGEEKLTLDTESCSTDEKFTVSETEFIAEVPNKTSTPTEDCVSINQDENVNNSITLLHGAHALSPEERADVNVDKTFKSSPSFAFAKDEVECLNKDVNTVFHSPVSRSLQETFDLLPEISVGGKTEDPEHTLNQTFGVLTDFGPESKSQVADSLDTTFDLPAVPCDKPQVAEDTLNKTFELESSHVCSDKIELAVGVLDKTFDLLQDVPLSNKLQDVSQPIDTTFELLPESSAALETEGVTEHSNKTFELLPEAFSSDKTPVVLQQLNEIELSNEDATANHSLTKFETKVPGFAQGVVEDKVTAVNGIDLNGNTQLQAVQHVADGKKLGGKFLSPPQKFVYSSSEPDLNSKIVLRTSEHSEQILRQVPFLGEYEICDHGEQSCNIASTVSENDVQSLPVKCESRDNSKLIELYKICDEQQKALEQNDEEFVNAESFFANQQEGLKLSEASPCSSLVETDLPKVKTSSTEVGQEAIFEKISAEAKRLSQQFAKNACEDIVGAYAVESVKLPDSAEMENTNRMESGNKSALGSSPASNRQSPRPMHGSRGSSPAKKPVANEGTYKIKPKAVSNTPKELDYTDVEDPFKPRSRIQNSPPRNQQIEESPLLSQDVKVCVENSLQNSFSNCHNHSEAGPDIAQVTGSEVFKDPSAFEFLSSFGSQQQSERNARLESLYVKFDPLLGTAASTNSEIVLPAAIVNGSHTEDPNSRLGDNTETPRKVDPLQQSAGTLAAGDTGSNGIQVTPSPASLLIDKLISLSPSPAKTSPGPLPPKQRTPSPRKAVDATPVQQTTVTKKAHPSPVPAAVKSGLTEMEQAAMLNELLRLKDLLNEQDAAHAAEVTQKNREMTNLQNRLHEAEERLTKANKQVADKVKTTKDMSVILDEYEKTISRLIADKEQEQRAHELQVSAIAKERDVHKGHLDTIEIAFSDLHKKYERSKEIIEGLRKNEEVLRASLAEYESSIRSKVQQYEALKKHAVAQLEDANVELESVRRSHAAETAKLQAMLKKAELKVSSLEEMLEQKIKENQELTHICDELINKVGAGN